MRNEKRNEQTKIASRFLPSMAAHARPEESNKKSITCLMLIQILKILREFGVPYGSRTRVAAVKEKEPVVIQ